MDDSAMRELGEEAVWSLSTAKVGFGISQLRDNSTETYWQSDGSQPHLVNIQFPKKVHATTLALYVDYRQDESYTPKKISLRAGTNYHDLAELEVFELVEPVGWIELPIRTAAAAAAAAAHAAAVAAAVEAGDDPPELDEADLPPPDVRTNFLQLAILSNHQNGRDTHIRMVRVYGPKGTHSLPGHIPPFSTVAFSQFAGLR